jgi:enoyl-CoA hydratase
MNKTASVRTEIDGPVSTIVMSRARQRNAVDRPMADALRDAFERFEADESQRVAVLWGEHGTFCAGLKAISGGFGGNANPLDDDLDAPAPMGPTRLVLNKPVIAAISGWAVAGGLELALWCDLRVVERSAVFGVFCRRFGVPLIDGGTIRLPRAIGMSRALDLILTGRPVDAREASAMGLVNRVVPHGQARQAAEALAREIASFPQQCMLADRHSAYAQWNLPLADALRQEGRLGVPMVAAEGAAGAERFVRGAGRHGAF